MGDHSKIEWTEATWNPTVGCSIVSPGCHNCYAMRMAARLQAMGRAGYEGVVKDGRWTGRVNTIAERLAEPLRWKRPRLIFVDSMSDLFHESVPFEFIDRVFAVMALCPQHTFQVLTKRPYRMAAYVAQFPRDWHWHFENAYNVDVMSERLWNLAYRVAAPMIENADDWELNDWPLPNVWLGTSVEDQKRADERRQPLMEIASAGWLTWVSYEPALGLVDWTGWEFIKWLVSGGESGPGARVTEPDWHRVARDFCAAEGVAFYFKQWGEFLPPMQDGADRKRLNCSDDFDRVGKKAAGRLLDGVLHDAFPSPQPPRSE